MGFVSLWNRTLKRHFRWVFVFFEAIKVGDTNSSKEGRKVNKNLIQTRTTARPTHRHHHQNTNTNTNKTTTTKNNTNNTPVDTPHVPRPPWRPQRSALSGPRSRRTPCGTSRATRRKTPVVQQTRSKHRKARQGKAMQRSVNEGRPKGLTPYQTGTLHPPPSAKVSWAPPHIQAVYRENNQGTYFV